VAQSRHHIRRGRIRHQPREDAALPLSHHTLTYTAGIIRRHRKQIGSPWRKLNPGRQVGARRFQPAELRGDVDLRLYVAHASSWEPTSPAATPSTPRGRHPSARQPHFA
jgi:hypothetical protein